MNPIFSSENELNLARQRFKAGDAELRLEADALAMRAQDLLTLGPWSVAQIEELAPSGNPHDYHSIAPCAWPDPNDPNGPWIEYADQLNPDLPNAKRMAIAAMAETVVNLAAGFYFLGNENDGRRAAMVLRRWFLDQATCMAPHLDYGQGIPGVCVGRGRGIIDTACLLGVVHAAAYLENTPYWTPRNHSGLQEWFRRYTTWLLDSPLAKEEVSAGDYHSTFCAAQIGAYTLFVNNAPFVERIFDHYRSFLVPTQMAADGSFRLEIERPASLVCALANLDGYALICEMAHQQGVDLYSWRTPDGRGFPTAVEFLVPYLRQPETWPYPQAAPYQPAWSLGIHLGASRLHRDDWRELMRGQSAGSDSIIGPVRLMHPLDQA